MSVCYVFFKLGNYPQARGTRPLQEAKALLGELA